jgi:hypothetical protein
MTTVLTNTIIRNLNSKVFVISLIGYNPDDGLKVVLLTKYLVNNFKQNPYTQSIPKC